MEEGGRCRVCVTGSAGYIGSWLVRKLLQRGHVVHATLRNTEDHIKVSLLRSFPGAQTRLRLFQIDLADASADYDSATAGCELVFHVATPMLHITDNSEGADTTDTAVSAAKRIAESCIRSGTVRRLLYMATVISASPVLENEPPRFGDCIDEDCWTPLGVPFSYCQQYERAYVRSKTTTEKELLKYNEIGSCGFKVVSVASALVGGDTALPYLSGSVQVMISPLTGDARRLRQLKFIQAVCGCVPLVHVDDVCEALVFCAEANELAGGGRMLCAAGYSSVQEIVRMHREANVGRVVVSCREDDLEPEITKKVTRGSSKMIELGFKYNHDVKDLLKSSVYLGRRLGELPAVE